MRTTITGGHQSIFLGLEKEKLAACWGKAIMQDEYGINMFSRNSYSWNQYFWTETITMTYGLYEDWTAKKIWVVMRRITERTKGKMYIGKRGENMRRPKNKQHGSIIIEYDILNDLIVTNKSFSNINISTSTIYKKNEKLHRRPTFN